MGSGKRKGAKTFAARRLKAGFLPVEAHEWDETGECRSLVKPRELCVQYDSFHVLDGV